MTCNETRDMFSSLADDALTPLERAALDAHLADCAECRRELARFERTVKLVRAIDPARAPVGFVDRVLAAARPAPWPQRLARRMARPWPTLPLGAAALLVVGGLAVLLFRGSPELQRAVQPQLEPPPVVTTPAPSSAPTLPSPPPAREPQKPAASASAPPKSAAEPPRATGKRAETPAEPKPKLSDERRNVAPPEVAQRFSTKSESSERAQAKRDVVQEPAAKRRSDAAPSVAQDAIAQAPSSPARDRQAAGATAKTQATPQISPLSRTGPMTGIPAPPPDVTAQLRAADVSVGERSLIELAARVGGRQAGRRIDAGRIVVELTVPRDAYAQFVREAAALGALSIEGQTTERPMLAVAVTVSN